MTKFRSKRRNHPGAGGGVPVRPQRAQGLTGSTVGVVLDSSGTFTILLNSWMAALHLVVGLMAMTLGLEDIVNGGPTRPTLMPVAGAYMASTVVFYTALRSTRPTVLAWILALSDMVMLAAVASLTLLDVWRGPEITFALIATAVTAVYSLHGIPRLTVTTSVLTIVVFFTTMPFGALVSDALLHFVRPSEIAAFLVLVVGMAAAVRTSVVVRARRTGLLISRLQRIDAVVSMRLTAADLHD